VTQFETGGSALQTPEKFSERRLVVGSVGFALYWRKKPAAAGANGLFAQYNPAHGAALRLQHRVARN